MKADRVRADTQLAILDIGRFIARRVEVYPCSAPQSDRQYVWHAEIGSHAADVDRQRGFTRETLCQHADVASGPADIHHDGVFDPRSAAHTSELQSLMRISYSVFC